MNPQPARLALRRVRPPRAIFKSQLRENSPRHFADCGQCFQVFGGVWSVRSNGCWWSVDAWGDTEEWGCADRRIANGLALSCLLVHDRLRRRMASGGAA